MTAATKKTNAKADSSLTVKKNGKEAQKAASPIDLEKRIQQVENLNIVIAKWRKLNQAKSNLDRFKLSNDGLSSTIQLTDASGNEFKTSHNVVVEAVLNEVKSVLDEKITETEAQIEF